jgi:hypothetical protein
MFFLQNVFFTLKNTGLKNYQKTCLSAHSHKYYTHTLHSLFLFFIFIFIFIFIYFLSISPISPCSKIDPKARFLISF